jgi:hypothetical protein
MEENRKGEEGIRQDESHDKSERHANWGDDHRQADPENEEYRAEARQMSQQKSKEAESTHPKHEKDTQSELSDDPTRKNEANQGTSDLRKRERTNFPREGEGNRNDG